MITKRPGLFAAALFWATTAVVGQPIALHPQNPHYFVYQNKPTVLITSGEHYGALLNPDFDFITYLNTLQKDGLNLTRVFSGTYVEPKGAFGITDNTLAPQPGRFLCPWTRSSEPGYAGGGNKFDLSRWDEAYFRRLNDFMTAAQQRGIIVEFTLFCPYYEELQWKVAPQNPANHVNRLDTLSRLNVHTLDKNKGLLAIQENLVRKLVTELNGFDNLMFEICNEPYFGGVTLDWQHHIADLIVATERGLPKKHLITQNIANGQQRIERPHPAVSVFNFHYATPPTTVALNYALNKALGDNETGFRGTADSTYRKEGWEYLLAGGALYNNLDYSFTTARPDGTASLGPKEPGGGSPALRRQLRTLSGFMNEFDFVRTRPDTTLLAQALPPRMRIQALSEPGRQYALYLYNGAHPAQKQPVNLSLNLPPGRYRLMWTHPETGRKQQDTRQHRGGTLMLQTPPFDTDMALLIKTFNP